MKRQIVNIVNFIRGTEPRLTMDLVTPVKEQIKLLKKYDLPGTFLVQYDALIDPVFTDMLKEVLSDKIEIGIWLEIVEPLALKAGCTWKGRYSWDYHAHCSFTVGYTLEERIKIIDVLMADFKEVFGFYPRSLGSWAFDAYTLEYLSTKYNMDAFCNCKEQWGTDGYTLWGGYYNQGYYPSKLNMLCPAQSDEMQINTPILRMLGSDPIYQYDFGMDIKTGATEIQGVVTLEPVYTGTHGGGGVPKWVDWYLKENFSGNCLNFGYTQVGQENSFGWSAMKGGLTYQFEKLYQLQNEGKVEIETLAETGKWFKKTYPYTPPTTVVAESDWTIGEHKSVWYNCKNYRINIYVEGNKFWIRDMYIFNETYRERYFENICTTNNMQFDNLPVIDGNRFSGNGIRAGIYPMIDGKELTFTDMEYKEENGEAIVRFACELCGSVTFTLSENGVRISIGAESDEFMLMFKYDTEYAGLPKVDTTSDSMLLNYEGFSYSLKLAHGKFTSMNSIEPTEGNIQFSLVD